MERISPAGVLPRKLLFSLTNPREVADARRMDTCLLCRCGPVNEAGICQICYGMLDGEELKVAVRWMSGQGP